MVRGRQFLERTRDAPPLTRRFSVRMWLLTHTQTAVHAATGRQLNKAAGPLVQRSDGSSERLKYEKDTRNLQSRSDRRSDRRRLRSPGQLSNGHLRNRQSGCRSIPLRPTRVCAGAACHLPGSTRVRASAPAGHLSAAGVRGTSSGLCRASPDLLSSARRGFQFRPSRRSERPRRCSVFWLRTQLRRRTRSSSPLSLRASRMNQTRRPAGGFFVFHALRVKWRRTGAM